MSVSVLIAVDIEMTTKEPHFIVDQVLGIPAGESPRYRILKDPGKFYPDVQCSNTNEQLLKVIAELLNKVDILEDKIWALEDRAGNIESNIRGEY